MSIPQPRSSHDQQALLELASHSVRLITGLQTPQGAYPASPSFSAYAGYCWLRDGAFIADAVSAAGEVDSASRFFDWCAGVIGDRADRISWIVQESRVGRPPAPELMLPTRFTFAGADGTDDWWDFQVDGYGTWLWALSEHLSRHGLDGTRWADAAALTVDYLLASWARPCYDWWEEHPDQVHVSTLACIAAGLDAIAGSGLLNADRTTLARQVAVEIGVLVAGSGVHDGHLVKWLGATTSDGSLAAAIAPLGFVAPDSDTGRATLATLDAELSVGGGVHRYLADTYFGGGLWPLLSCFLGLAHAAAGNVDRAEELLDWAAGTAGPDLALPEQVPDHLIAPGMRQHWIDRWGPVATPLLWSHAMVLRLGIALGRVPVRPSQSLQEES